MAGNGRWGSRLWRIRLSKRAVVAILDADLRGGLPGLQLRVSARAGTHDALDALAVGIEGTLSWLDPGRRHPGLLRDHQPRVVDPGRGASDW